MIGTVNETVKSVTDRIIDRSEKKRAKYLKRIRLDAEREIASRRMSCANLAHAFATESEKTSQSILVDPRPNLGIVTSYNDMLSAHQPYSEYPDIIRKKATALGARAQVAGATPAMCDGVTQGEPGMELSLLSRDVIAMSTAIALSHDVYDAALLLGVCDKIVPGLLIGALSSGHLPCVFVPAGPMGSGIANVEKSKWREMYAQGNATREELFEAEQRAYHGAGTCTFYGTANSNQVLLEAMGLHVPGAAFIPPYTPLRQALTEEAVTAAWNMRSGGENYLPIGELVNEKTIVNALVVLLATGGSTNHLIHWVAVAKAAGITLNWSDVDALSKVVPLLARIYPNGPADINDFERAGGTGFVIQELLVLGLLHEEVMTVTGLGVSRQIGRPSLIDQEAKDQSHSVTWSPPAKRSEDSYVVRPATDPFAPTGGLTLLDGNIGRAVMKISAVDQQNRQITAPAFVADSQEEVVQAYRKGLLDRDVVVVVRFQGPKANGMPELHRLTPILGSLLDAGHQVALVTDGRMSGASGKVPAAIHLSPEAAAGGDCSRIKSGDLITVDACNGTLNIEVDKEEFARRQPAAHKEKTTLGLGRDLFTNLRTIVSGAEQGACVWG